MTGQFYFYQIMYTLIAYTHEYCDFFYWSVLTVHLNFTSNPKLALMGDTVCWLV